MTLRIYDTRAGKKVPFEPLVPGKVGMYACGITVYDLCHVGHARMLVAFDVIVRHLRASGFEVRFVRNVTDVDDKIIRKAKAEGTLGRRGGARSTPTQMNADMRALGVAPADVEPRATEHIAEVIDIIRRLEEKGLAYAAGGDVYYAVGGFADYGELSGQSTDDLKAGARIEVDEQKRSPLDFALWKGPSRASRPGTSPWGTGPPRLAHRVLGDGAPLPRRAVRHPRRRRRPDLPPPRERDRPVRGRVRRRAASRATGCTRAWCTFGGEKMSKSLGNVVTIRKVGRDARSRGAAPAVHRRPLPQPGRLHAGQGRPAAARCIRSSTTPRSASSTSTGRWPGWPRRPSPTTRGRRAPRGREDVLPISRKPWTTTSTRPPPSVTSTTRSCSPTSCSTIPRRRPRTCAAGRSRACAATCSLRRDAGDSPARRPPEFLAARRDRQCARKGIDAAAVEAKIPERAAARAAKDFARADEIRKTLRRRASS